MSERQEGCTCMGVPKGWHILTHGDNCPLRPPPEKPAVSVPRPTPEQIRDAREVMEALPKLEGGWVIAPDAMDGRWTRRAESLRALVSYIEQTAPTGETP